MTNQQDSLISIGQINFINCLPVNHSFHIWAHERIKLSNGYPTLINQLINDKQVHIAPVSSIEYIKNQDKYTLIDSICIGSDGEVGSVILFSNYEIKDLSGKKIGIPYTSATSIALLKVLLKENNVDLKSIHFINHKYDKTLDNALKSEFDAVLYIGDPALKANIEYNQEFKKIDLGLEWKKITGYPMVFATWVARSDWKLLNENDYTWVSFLLNKAVEAGLSMYFNEIVNLASNNLNIDKIHIEDYFTKKINYNFTSQHLESLNLFKKLYYSVEEVMQN